MKKQTAITIIDPKEFGIEDAKAGTIEQSFLPKKIETEGFGEVYKAILSKEITEETSKEARELRLKLVKVRTGISDIHKAEKAFFLASGKYVDALKNKLTIPVQQMEEKLMEIEKYFENIELERKNALRIEREQLLSQFGTDTTFIALSEMSAEQFSDLFAKEKLSYETKIEKERKEEELRIEEERKDKAAVQRKLSASGLINFFDEDFDFRNSTDEEFDAQLLSAKSKKEADDKAREEQAKEIERLRKEREEKEEAEKKEVERRNKLFSERLKAISPFNANASNLSLADMSGDEFKSLLAKSKSEHEDRVKKEKELSELKAKQDAELKAKQEKEEADKKALLAPDVDKLRSFYVVLKGIEYPNVSSKEAQDAISRAKKGIYAILIQLSDDAKKLK